MQFTFAKVFVATAMVAVFLMGSNQVAIAQENATEAALLPKHEPISWRLKGTLKHSNKENKLGGDISMVAIQFSPDGKQLIAGDYPGGIINLWNVESRQRINKFEADTGYRGAFEYFRVSLDWKYVFSPTNSRVFKHDEVDRGGTTFVRWEFGDSIRVWNLESGELTKTLKHVVARQMDYMEPSPDSVHFICYEGVPGEYPKKSVATYPNVLSMWNLETGEHRPMPREVKNAVYSPSGHRLAAEIKEVRSDGEGAVGIAVIDDLDTLELRRLVSFSPLAIASPIGFLADNRVLLGSLTLYERKGDLKNITKNALKFWDATTGEELLSVDNSTPDATFSWCKIGPDGRTAAVISYRLSGGMTYLYLLDAVTRKVRRLELGERAFSHELSFDPSGKWLAVPTNSLPDGANERAGASHLPQPRIFLVDIGGGKIAETMISRQAWAYSAAFSSDGKTLATSGNGEVLLWDFSVPPGQPRGN